VKKLLLILSLIATPVWAVEPDEVLADPVLEQRARDISANVRCVQCQNEPIDSSNASIARDLRFLIRERLVAGDTNAEVNALLVSIHGDYVLFKPPFKPSTYVLWLAPFALIGIGGIAVAMTLTRKAKASVAEPLSASDQDDIDKLMDNKE
jgi:cytochrome c-type biogenesis protein CcmH